MKSAVLRVHGHALEVGKEGYLGRVVCEEMEPTWNTIYEQGWSAPATPIIDYLVKCLMGSNCSIESLRLAYC